MAQANELDVVEVYSTRPGLGDVNTRWLASLTEWVAAQGKGKRCDSGQVSSDNQPDAKRLALAA